MKKFIITSDSKTAEQFMAAGFKLVSESSGVYTFFNVNNNFNFSSIDGKSYCFTNMLTF